MSWERLATFGAVLGWLAGSVLRIRRRAVVTTMQRARVTGASEMYTRLGAGVFELLWLAGSRDWEEALAHVEIPPFDRPCVLAASHTANWELVAAAGTKGGRVAIVAKAIRMGAFHAFCNDLRRRAGLEVIAPEGALANAKRVLDRGGVVAMPIDQVPDRTGLAVSFLGAEAVCDRAPALLAYRANVPLVVLAARREGRRLVAEVLLTLRPEGGRAWIDEATRAATAALETFVRAHPTDWMWLHRRWRAPILARPTKRD